MNAKRFMACVCVGALILALLCGCGRAKVSEPFYTQETSSAASSEELRTAPALSEGAETRSTIAGSFLADEDGTLYTVLADAPGVVYLPDVLPEDVGYIHVFLPADGIVYAIVREDALDLGSAGLYAFDLADGGSVLLADDCSGGGSLILVGDYLYYECADGGINRCDLNTGACESAVPDGVTLYAAADGYLYYTKADGAVYRNDSTLGAEYMVMESFGSLWFFCTDAGLCDVTYTNDGTVPVLQFRDVSGNLLREETLPSNANGYACSGDTVWAVLPDDGALCGWSISGGTQTVTVPFSDAAYVIKLNFVTDDTVYYTRLDNGMLYLACAGFDGGASQELAAED